MERTSWVSARRGIIGACVAAIVFGLIGFGAAYARDKGDGSGKDSAGKKSTGSARSGKDGQEKGEKYEPPKVDCGVGGFVIDGKSGKPLTSARVVVYEKKKRKSDEAKEAGTGAPDAERGGYAIQLEEGEYVVVCSADGYVTAGGPIRVRKKGMIKANFGLLKPQKPQQPAVQRQAPSRRKPVQPGPAPIPRGGGPRAPGGPPVW